MSILPSDIIHPPKQCGTFRDILMQCCLQMLAMKVVLKNTCVTEFEPHNTDRMNIEQCSYNSLLHDAQMSLR